MDFAVLANGEEQGRWVLAVDGDHVLITDEEQRLRWVDMADCKFLKVATPEMPRPVVLVQPQKAIAVPQMKLVNGRH